MRARGWRRTKLLEGCAWAASIGRLPHRRLGRHGHGDERRCAGLAVHEDLLHSARLAQRALDHLRRDVLACAAMWACSSGGRGKRACGEQMPAAQRLPCAARLASSPARRICSRTRGSRIATVRDSRSTFEVLKYSTTKMKALAAHLLHGHRHHQLMLNRLEHRGTSASFVLPGACTVTLQGALTCAWDWRLHEQDEITADWMKESSLVTGLHPAPV